MKLKIHNVSSPEWEKEVSLKLEYYDKDTVRLIVCDSEGKRMESGSLLGITKDGIILYSDVNPDFGFRMDSANRISATPK